LQLCRNELRERLSASLSVTPNGGKEPRRQPKRDRLVAGGRSPGPRYQKFLGSSPAEARRKEVAARIEHLRVGKREDAPANHAASASAGMAPRPEYAQMAYRAGEEAYRKGNFALAAERFEQAFNLAKFPTIQYDIAQAYRRSYEADHDVAHLKRAIDAYRIFLQQAPNAKQHNVAEKFLAMLDVEMVEVGAVHDAPTPTVRPSLKTFEAPSAAVEVVGATPVPVKQPVYKKWWLWTAVGVGVVAIAVGAGVGATQNRPDGPAPTVTFSGGAP